MDTNVLAGGGVGATIIVIIGIIYKLINHKKLVSRCCGRKVDMSLDIGDTTPEPQTPKPKAGDPPA